MSPRSTRPLRIASNLRLPLDAVTETFAILAKRGVGKTYTAAVMVEEMLNAGAHVVVADPIGVWWGLRASSDGKSPGLPIVIFGGDHGDVPLEVGAGELVADIVTQETVSVVLDLSRFRKGEQVRFMTDFSERLYHRNRDPLHLVLDEADSFAPQRPMKGQERMLGACEDLVRRGRARGIGVTLVTQRSAVLNKDVLTQAEVLIALRTIAPQDRKAIDEWIKVHGTETERDTLMRSLPSLPVGTAWFWSPGWLDIFTRVKVRKRTTFDSSATPKAGRRRSEPKRLAEVDLSKLRERISSTIERAKATDPRHLRLRIAELEKEVRAKEAKVEKTVTVEEKIIEVPVLSDEQVAEIAGVVAALTTLSEDLTNLASSFSSSLAALTSQATPAPAAKTSRTDPPPARSPRTSRTDPPRSPSTNLRRGERRMLDVLARHTNFRVTRSQLGTLAGFSPRGGTFSTYLGVLKRSGYLTEASGILQITDGGMAALGIDAPLPPTTTEEVLDQWRSALRAGERRMLDELVTVYPRALSREELADRAGFEVSGGTFSTYLGVLRRNGLIEVNGGEVRASETLFISGK